MQTKSLFVHRAAVLAALVLATVAVPQLAAQPRPLITEFMAINNTSLKDEDGSYPDWIEIYNPSPNPVNLEGWFLTDRSGNLTKWRFPATNLNAFSYLIVYASSKDRAVAGAPLHANFSLDGGGEYLALVDNQTNVVYAFAPAYPDQLGNNSYGPGMLASPAVQLVPVGATARFLVPTADIGSSWTARLFDDTAWGRGPTGLGFDGGTNYTSAIATNLAAQMQGVSASLYTRLPFEVADPSSFQELKLRLRYDDGFIAYLNGTEIVRANAPPSAAWNSTALYLHGSEVGAVGQTVANFDTSTSPYTASIAAGAVAPAPAVQAANAGSTGQFLRLINDGVGNQGGDLAFDRAMGGAVSAVTADFDFRVSDANNDPADGFAFMLIPTSVYGTNGPGAFRAYSGIEDPNFAGVFAVGFDVYPHASANDVSVHWNGMELQSTNIPRATLDMVSNQFHRCSVKLEFVPDGSGAYATVSLIGNVNGTPGATLVPIDRQFIAGLAPYECRAEFAGRTGGSHMAVDFDNINIQYYQYGMVPAEEFDVSRFLGLLVPGTNVLAIHGLNIAATNADFLLEPLLLARGIIVQSNQPIYFSTPTPGALNATGAAEVAPHPQFSWVGGIYTNNFVLELSSPLPGAVIHYTLNGIPVTELSPTYTNSISVTGSVIVSTRVFAPGYLPSPQFSQYYTLVDPALATFSSGLPVVIVDTLGQRLIPDMNPKATGIFTVIDTAPTTGRSTLQRKPDFQGRAGLEGRGQTSWGTFPKKPFNVEIRGEDDIDKEVGFLDFPPGADFALVNVYNDKTFLNDFLAHELFEKMGHYSVRRRFVEVFYNGTMEGQGADPSPKVGSNDRVGIYLLIEKIRIDNDRVNIATPQSGAPNDPITGGYMWKKDKHSPSDVNFETPRQPVDAAAGSALKYHDPRPENLTAVQRAWLVNHLTEFENVLYSADYRDPVNGYAKYIDVGSFVDQHWIVEYTKQIDGYRLSNYMYKDRDGKINMSPIWDWNLSFGNGNYLEGGRTNGWYWPLLREQEHIWLRRLLTDADFNQRIVDRWPELSQGDGPFNLTNLLARIKQLSDSLTEASVYDFSRWPRLGTYIWPNPNGATGGWHVDYQTPTTYSAVLTQMTNWLVGRHRWIDSQYLKAPALSRYAGTAAAPLTMSAAAPTNAVIYYTLDGSDPRLPGGTVSPKALAYGGTFTPPADARIMARTWFTNTWSPAAKATLTNSVPRLAITEIMYHPTPGGAFEAEEYEYLELMNTTTNTIDLSGLRVAGGVDFTFPLGPLQATGSDTTNNFDVTGTAYTAAKLGSDPAASVVAGGPAGSYLRLLTQNSTNRNRIAFDQTATGPYDKVTAEFDFRGQNLTVPQVVGVPTVQTFDSAGSTYVLNSFDADLSTPVVMPAETGSSGSYVRLTKTVGSENGGIYFDATADRAYNIVLINFDFRCNGAADGFGLVFLNTANHGVSGGTPSFSEDANAAGSIGAGFDIYANASPPTATEPNANHVSLHNNGAQITAAVTPTLSLTANKFHRAQMTIVFTNGQALVTLKISPDINGAGGVTETLYTNFVISGVSPYRGRVAFCGRTGGANANQDIDNVNVQYMDSLPVAAGGLSLVMLPAAAFGATGTGSGLANYTDVPSASNLFALNFDIHAESSINDANLYWNGKQAGNITIPAVTLNLDSGVFHRARLELARTTEGSLATLTITPDVLGAGGTPVVVYSNLLVAGYYPGDARVEFAGRSGGQNLNLDVDNVSIRYAVNAINPLAPGARILLVKNAAAFAARYGTNLTITGQYTGQLDNGGERLVIYGRYGEPILDFSYQDAWQPLSDGYGFALVPNDPNAPQNLWDATGSWRLSSAVGGTPGQADATLPAFAPVVVNEVLSHVVAPAIEGIELHNPATNAADISHWYLTDNFNQPYKYRFPTNTVIPAGGYLVVTEAQYNAPGAPNGFGLRAEGEEVYLFSANANGELTGYYHGFDFGPSDANVSFGRHLTSTGDDHFVAQSAMTFGTNNAGPRVGPVVVTEVMYHPPDYAGGVDNPDYEFIELQNITGEPVWLFDPLNPQNTWRLRDAVDFQFPAGTVLPPGGRVLVVNFDPAADPAMLQAFRAKYALGSGVGILGPYDGKLDNSTDRVELVKPGQIDATTGQPDFILVDKVKYSDDPTWPQAADGTGYSLQRRDPAQYGNDPANWIAAPPTALAGLVLANAPVLTTQPASQTVYAHSNVSLSVAVTGDGPLAYQWRFNGNNLAGATNAELVLQNIQVAQAGGYQATVLGPNGAADSQTAWVQVFQAPTFLVQPKSGVLVTNSSTNLTVSATGNGPVSLQWRFNSVDIPGATNATLSLTNLQYSQSGDYTAVASDGVGSVASQPATIIVARVPTVSVPGVVATVGSTVTLTATVAGSEPMAYRWRLSPSTSDLVPFGKGTTSFVITNVQLSQAGIYQIAVSNALRPNGVNGSGVVVAAQPPADRVAAIGGSVALQAFVNPISYARMQWQFGGSNLVGQTAPTLLLTNLEAGQAGVYTFTVTNNFNTNAGQSYTCNLALVDNPVAPAITLQPTNFLAPAGGSAQFGALASGTEMLAYQWWFNETNRLAGATNASLVLTNVGATNAGLYQLIVTNNVGAATSEVATLTLLQPPTIIAQPQSTQTVAGVGATLLVAATGAEPLRYQWWHGRYAALVNATNATLSPADSGDYQVVVSNPYGVVTSSVATLTVAQLPEVIVQPQAQSLAAGGSADLYVVAYGDAPITYQWWFNQTNLLAGQNNSVLRIRNIQAETAGAYTVVLTNASGAATSIVAMVTLGTPNNDTDGDGLPDDWELAHGLTVGANDAALDLDGDGLSNLQEYLAGTLPNSAASVFKVDAITGGGAATLQFLAVSNRAYAVEFRGLVGAGTWGTLTNLASQPTNRTVIVTDPNPALTNRFYRIVLPGN